MFAFGAQAFAAGGEDMQVRRGAQQRLAELGHGVDQMLAGVDDQQQLPFLERPHDGFQGLAVL
jgi:hypothetical protein